MIPALVTSHLPTQGYIYPVIGLHVSLLCGLLSYASRDADRDASSDAGADTLEQDRNLRKLDQVARIVPVVSAICGAAALSGFFLAPMRTPAVLVALVGAQVAAMFLASAWR